jgi:integrase
MAREIGRLSSAKIRSAKRPGMYADGGGLYLHVGPTGAKSWIYRFMLRGKAREMGLGPLHTIGLAEARQRTLDCRRQRFDGIDPLEARNAERAKAKLDAAKAITFDACAEAYIAAHRAAWRNTKHAGQWNATLRTYVSPAIGKLPIAAIDTGLVTKILGPIWTEKPETASRVRGRVESILDYATTLGWRTGENPARWRGHLENVLPARSKVRKVEHHAALPWAEIGPFMAELRQQEGVGARALEFAILTAARTGEVIGARWSEVDLAAAVWTIPAERMKAGAEHRVPLSQAAMDVLRRMEPMRDAPDGFVFPGQQRGRPLSNMTLLAVLKRMRRPDLTTHGFRSSFRDWCAETTGYPHEVAEAALAHAISDKTEAAYRRGDLFEKRRRLMAEWAAFSSQPTPAGDVVALRTAGQSR